MQAHPDDKPAPSDHALGDLRTPLTLPCGQQLPNRVAKAAMTEGLSDAGMNATPALETLYRRWSRGGAGLLITGNVQIDRWDLERPGNVVIDGDADQAALTRWAAAAREGGNRVWMQLSHAGRQAPLYCTPRPVAPSAVGLKLLGAYRTPRALTRQGIESVIERFVHAATVARDAGFDGVQVHGAHGYLLSEFLSPVTNRRSDDYGGSLENRARLLLEVVRAVRGAVGPDFAVGVKLNSADFQKGGFTNDECLQVVRWLNDCHIDLLEISGGSYEQPRLLGHSGDAAQAQDDRRESTKQREAYFMTYAALIREAATMPLMVTGGFRSRDAMVDALASGDTDVIGLGRPLCVDPAFVQREAYFMTYAALIREAATMPLMVTGGFRSRDAMVDALASGDTDVIGLGRPLCVDPAFVQRLFERTTERAEDPGAELAYGAGKLGPRSSISALRFLNIFSQMGWYYVQLMRMGRGLEPDWKMPLWKGLLGHVKAELAAARRIRPFQKKAQTLDAD